MGLHPGEQRVEKIENREFGSSRLCGDDSGRVQSSLCNEGDPVQAPSDNGDTVDRHLDGDGPGRRAAKWLS